AVHALGESVCTSDTVAGLDNRTDVDGAGFGAELFDLLLENGCDFFWPNRHWRPPLDFDYCPPVRAHLNRGYLPPADSVSSGARLRPPGFRAWPAAGHACWHRSACRLSG